MCRTLASRADTIGAAYKPAYAEVIKLQQRGIQYDLDNTRNILTLATAYYVAAEHSFLTSSALGDRQYRHQLCCCVSSIKPYRRGW